MLDATALGATFLAHRFPTIDTACHAAGIDWSQHPVPVTPAAHFAMGGVVTDLHGRTSVPGLFAVGEVACTGAHGANRLASNSFLEGLVFGHRAADAIGEPWEQAPEWAAGPSASVVSAVADGSVANGSVANAPADGEPFDRGRLHEILWAGAGLHRDQARLERASRDLAALQMPEPGENANLLQIGRLVVAAALSRKESRGAHFRSDFPFPATPTPTHTVLRPLPAPTEASVPC